MLTKLPCLMFVAASVAMGFPLAVNYSEWLGAMSVSQIATDNAGSLYILSGASVTKLSADGKTVVWQNQLGFSASAMAVDPSGGVYVVPVKQSTDLSVFVAKLGGSGTGIAWKIAAGFNPMSPAVLAADSQGRAYLAAQSMVNNFITRTADVVRINAEGAAIEYTTQIMGTPTSIAVDPSGAAFLAGAAVNAQGVGTGFAARIAPDGSAGFYSVLDAGSSQTIALDATGNASVFGAQGVQRLDSTGNVKLLTHITGQSTSFALDADGNAYFAVVTNELYPVKNSLATCGFDSSSARPPYAELLTVIDPDGATVQTTYLPGGNVLGSLLIATAANSTVFVTAAAGPGFVPTQAGPFSGGTTGSIFLTSLLGNGSAPTVSLVCMGSSASLMTGAISPGELVTLFGNGLGPQQGVQTQASAQSPFPSSAAGVEVTFDGTPAPLLWVQDAQINVLAPWALTPGRNTKVCVLYNSTATNCLMWPVVQTAPAVFTVDGTYAAAVNQDGTFNSKSNPAAVGSIVSVYATGLGPITPSQADGTLVGFPLPLNAISVKAQASYTVGIPFGVEVDVPFGIEYAGPAPGLVAGASQINFRVAAYASYGAIYLILPSAMSPAFELYIEGQ